MTSRDGGGKEEEEEKIQDLRTYMTSFNALTSTLSRTGGDPSMPGDFDFAHGDIERAITAHLARVRFDASEAAAANDGTEVH